MLVVLSVVVSVVLVVLSGDVSGVTCGVVSQIHGSLRCLIMLDEVCISAAKFRKVANALAYLAENGLWGLYVFILFHIVSPAP